MPVGAGVVGPGIATPGTGGSVPKNLVIGGPSESVTSIEIPSLSGDPDILVPAGAGNSQYNDDFDQAGSGVPSPWSLFGANVTADTNTALSQLHLFNTSAANSWQGIYRAVTLTFPATITIKLSDASLLGTGQSFFVGVSPVQPGSAGTGNACALAWASSTSVAQWVALNMATGAAGSSTNATQQYPSCYLRIKMASATAFQAQQSQGGYCFSNVGAAQTPTGMAYVVIGCNGFTVGDNEMFVDWIRFT